MDKIEKLVRSNILNLNPYKSARDEFEGNNGTFLNANENPFGTLNRYPDPYQKTLKNKLANLKSVNYENIFIGNGSDEVIDLAYRIFCEPGKDKAITLAPTFGMYEVSANINNINVIKFPLNENFQLDQQKLTPHFSDKNIKLFFICSPNNPTGNLINQKDIQFILENFKGIVLIDEAYIDFANTDSNIKLINDYDNLIVIQTFSKAWGLAAARVGVGYANSKIINFYNNVKPPYNVSQLNQEAAIAALDNFENYNNELTQILIEKEKLQASLLQINLIKKIYPSDANFLLVEVGDANKLYKDLIDHKIITRNRSNQINNCLRITVGTTEENNQLVNSLKKLNEENTFYR